MQKALFSYL